MSLNMSGLATGMAVAVGVLMMMTLVIFAYYLCNRVPPYPPRTVPAGDVQQQSLDVADLVSYPKLLFSTAKKNHRDATSCSICLSDYKDSDVIRLLPLCDHIFHHDCIDSWLLLRSTCPLCRT